METPIASELSYAVLLKQRREQDAKDGKTTAPVERPSYPALVVKGEK